MNLPVYRDLYHLNVSLLNIIENIPKIHRHTLGNRIVDTGLSSLQLLQRAYDATSHLERLHEISSLFSEIETLSTYLRIANESKIIPLKKATNLFTQLDKIKRQLVGWKKATKEKLT